MEKLRERLVGQRRKNCGGRVREREREIIGVMKRVGGEEERW